MYINQITKFEDIKLSKKRARVIIIARKIVIVTAFFWSVKLEELTGVGAERQAF